MSKLLYAKLAASNLKKNRQNILPYLLSSIGTVMMFFIMASISANEGLNQMLEGSTSIGMEYGPRAEAGLLTSQRVIEEMFQDIVMNDTPVEEAAKAAEDKLNDLFSTLG